MAGETTTTTKKAAQAAGKPGDADNPAVALGDTGQAAGAVDGKAAGAASGADAGSAQASAAQGLSEAELALGDKAAQAQAPAPGRRIPGAMEVISRVDGFWRGDRQWTHEPQTVRLDELTERQLDEIENEPLLITRVIYEDQR